MPNNKLDSKYNEAKQLITVGRLIQAKGFDVLISAFAKLDLPEESKLIIVGEGPEMASLVALSRELGVENNVVFTGYCANPYALMSQSDLFILSSRWEGYVNTLVEAMALGMRIVATDCNSEPGLYLKNELGKTLVPVDDSDSLAAAITDEIDRTPSDYSGFVERHRFREAAQKYVENDCATD